MAQPPRRERGLTALRAPSSSIVLLTVVLAAGGPPAGGCTRHTPAAEDVHIAWDVSPAPPSVGPAAIRFTLEEDGAPVAGARLRIEAYMTHPGMAPVTADVRDRGDGSYEAALTFTMAGDWVVVAEGTLPDGRPLRHQLSVPGVRDAR